MGGQRQARYGGLMKRGEDVQVRFTECYHCGSCQYPFNKFFKAHNECREVFDFSSAASKIFIACCT